MSGISTKLLHTHYQPNKDSGDIIPPIHISTTFKFGNEGKYDYSRSGNPTREVLEKTLAALDEVDYGLAFSSGSAVLATVVASLPAGKKILFSSDAYGGTYRYIVNVSGKQNVGYVIADFTQLTGIEKILATNEIAYVWVETPTNPLMKVADIEKLSTLAHAHKALLIVDNTFATPVIQMPIRHGADAVAYSTTKYINGHSDAVGGALTTNNKELFTKIKFLQNAIGAILSPFDSWLTLRGLRTLELRMSRHVENATHLAHMLSRHPKIKKVYYPGLFTGEQGKIVKKQMKNPGAMMSIELKEKYNVQKFLRALHYFPLAESLGGVESLIDHPASMTHASIPKAEREKIGLSDNLFRVSVGIENVDDLTTDLKQALEKA
jgi:cystathionine gamma-lyase